MAARILHSRILHFGKDDCNRVAVLRSAGYFVEACPSLLNLDSALDGDAEVAAVVFSDALESTRREALTLVHSRSSAPVILFEHTTYSPDEAAFDLVVSNLTPAKNWLDDIAATIARSRALYAQSKTIRERSSALIRETAAIGTKAIKERQRSARLRAESEEILNSDPEKRFPDSY